VRTDDGYHALIYLDAAKAIAVRPGQPAEIKSPAFPGVALPGKVLTISPAPATQYLVTVVVTGVHPKLRHGLPVDVGIITYTKNNVLTVPNTAVTRRGDKFFVHVLEASGRRRRVQFTPGLIGHDTTEVLEGLTDGQEVILSTPEPGQDRQVVEPSKPLGMFGHAVSMARRTRAPEL
jgi:multidrug efflux pump subunit AcrA (membrane-fusion protein)